MGTGRAELVVGVHCALDPVASEGVILASGPLANDLEPESLKFGEGLRLSETVEEFLRCEDAAIGKMPQSCCDGGLRGIGLILAFIAYPDLWAGKATTGEERLQAKLIAFLHRRHDFLAGDAVDQCLMFGLVGHIGLFGQEGMIQLQGLLEAGKTRAQDTVDRDRRGIGAFCPFILGGVGKTVQDAVPILLREQLVQIAQILFNALGAAHAGGSGRVRLPLCHQPFPELVLLHRLPVYLLERC
jgi:hypothetical protein